MIIRLLFLLFNVCILYSKSLVYSKLELEYLDLNQKFSLKEINSFSENYINFEDTVFAKLATKDDDFLYKNIQENENLNIEKTIESHWGKKAFRFSAISVGTFPVALFVSLFFFDLSYYFQNNMDSKYLPYPFSSGFKFPKDETLKKFMISASAGLAISLVIALIDLLLQ
ncbi:hypothetical protein [Candidatus Borreliella tachyglossi]|uniref:hypothetical protein n=1 Tax=Candidatus Borreliella tachyglossi TaxID=1964448 RepID=UPI004041F1F5